MEANGLVTPIPISFDMPSEHVSPCSRLLAGHTWRISKAAPSMDEITKEILESFAKGEEKTTKCVYKYVYQIVCRHIWMYTRSKEAVDDITQDIMLKVWEKIGTFRGDCQPKTWLFTIARNACLDYIRRERSRTEEPVDENNDPTPCAERNGVVPEPLRKKDRAAVLRIIMETAKLNDKEHVVVIAYLIRGRKNWAEVAEDSGLPEGTVRRVFHDAIKKMQNAAKKLNMRWADIA